MMILLTIALITMSTAVAANGSIWTFLGGIYSAAMATLFVYIAQVVNNSLNGIPFNMLKECSDKKECIDLYNQFVASYLNLIAKLAYCLSLCVVAIAASIIPFAAIPVIIAAVISIFVCLTTLGSTISKLIALRRCLGL